MSRRARRKIWTAGTVLSCALFLLPLAGAIQQSAGGQKIAFGARQLGLLGNSLALGVPAALLAAGLGFLGALGIYCSGFRERWYRYYFLLSIPVPFYVYALSWMYLMRFAARAVPGALRYSVKGLGACIFVETLAYFPLAMLIILAGMENIDGKKIEMASVYRDGNGVAGTVLAREAYAYVLSAAGLVLVSSMTDFSVPSMFQYHTYALDLFSLYGRTGDALAVYLQCAPMSVLLAVPLVWFLGAIGRFNVSRRERGCARLRLHGWLRAGCRMALAVSLLQIFVPAAVFLVTSESLGLIAEAFGLIRDELSASVRMSAMSGIAALALAYFPAAYLSGWGMKMPCAQGRMRKFAVLRYAPCILPLAGSLAIPGAIQAMGLLKMVNGSVFHGLQESLWLPALGCAMKLSPFLAVLLAAARRRMDRRAAEMAEILSVDGIAWIWVELRLMRWGYLSAFLLAFLLSFAEEGIPLVLMAPGEETATVKIYNYLHYGASEYVSAFSLIVIALIFSLEAVVALGYRNKARKGKRDRGQKSDKKV